MAAQQPIEMVRGTTNSINVTIYNGDGSLYELSNGAKLILGVKRNLNNSNCCLKKVLTEGTGEFVFRLCPEDTLSLPCGKLYYDVGLQDGEDYFPIVKCSPFVLTHNVTTKEV